ncbi:syndetin-like isoform X2 [Halichondria panicea]|uniref:syndetin-like isoform X2 n=1 Tax=Halichondria panicea TaxID=6063 RepID=UPI00312B55BD
MAALKSRVKSFLSGFQSKGHDDEQKDEEIHALQPPDLPHGREDLRKTEEVIEDIDQAYFSEPEFDCSELELKRTESELDVPKLEDRIFVLKTQDNAIYRKIYDLVFANYTAYVQELENVTMLQVSLQQASTTCINARRQLTEARKGVSHGGLGLLAKHRRRERLRALLDILRTLKTLQRTDARLKELLQECDYPSATQICIECQDVIQTYKQYSCVRELATSLQDIQTDIERELEDALEKLCSRFKADRYEQVQESYQKLGKIQTAVDTLLMKFTTTVHDTAYSVVQEHAGSNLPQDDLAVKMNYSNLCKLVTPEQFIPCLMEICFAVWRILHNYYKVREWHSSSETTSSGEGQEASEETFNRNYVRTKLENGLLRVWRDVQQKVRPYLLAADMSQFKYDDFLRVLEIVNRLISVGVEFCGEGSDSLQESMRQQSLKYFKNYHRGRLEELKLFLENEAWEPCPVRSSFNTQKLREFRFLREVATSPLLSKDSTSKNTVADSSLFQRYSLDENPFSQDYQEEEGEDVIEYGGFDDAVSDDERMDEEDSGEKVGQAGNRLRPPVASYRRQHSSNTRRGPLLSNTTLTVLRFFGNYIQMMNALQTIASDVLECLSQLFDYYLFAVYKFFTVDLLQQNREEIQLSTKLTTTLTRIEETLINQDSGAQTVVMTPDGGVKVPYPVASPFVGLDDPEQLYGLHCRTVAVESLVFLANQFVELLPYLKKYVQDSKHSFLEQFLSHTIKTVQELRRPIYHGISSKAVPFDQILQVMSSVKWDLKEIMSQHSGYVDQLLQEFTKFQKKTDAIDRRIHFPMEANNMLWERAILLSNRMFVEGFAQAKKCSNEGRALMQVDFQQFRTQLEKMSGIRPLPHHSYVEDYIKAYYLSEADTEDWIRKHQEYTAKQLQSMIIVGVGSRSGKKSRQRLLAIVDEVDRR